MLAEFDVEIGGDAPTLIVPWIDESSRQRYIDLLNDPNLVEHISEAADPALRVALMRLNCDRYFTAKCDLWTTTSLEQEETVFAAAYKCASYIDLVLRDVSQRADFLECERRMRSWVQLLRAFSSDAAAASFVLRACTVFDAPGYYWTIYVSGFAENADSADATWQTALAQVVETVLSADSNQLAAT